MVERSDAVFVAKSTPSISVVLASYNGAKYIGAQVESILHQMKETDELIVVDDASNDLTVAFLNEQFPRVKVVQNPKNVGHCRTFERGIALAVNDVVVLSDQDDVWIPGRLEIVREKFLSIEKPLLLTVNPVYCDESLVKLHVSDFRYREPSGRGTLAVLRFLLGRSNAIGCLMAFNQQFACLSLPIPTPIRAHDHWLYLTAAFRGYHLHTGVDGVLYRRHSGTQSVRRRSWWPRISDRVVLLCVFVARASINSAFWR